MVTLKDIIKLAKELPEEVFAEVYESMNKAKQKNDEDKRSQPTTCPDCGNRAVKNGKKDGSQSFLCTCCKRSFLERATSAIAHSHSSKAVWKAVIEDTIHGVSIKKTATDLELSRQTIFNMRHKILSAIEQEILANPVLLEGTCEVDETYVLECEKGREFTQFHQREPRNNGKASKQGLSEEFICLCTSVTGEGKLIARAVNRATPSKEEIEEVFGSRIEDDTLLLVDGNKSYNTLKDRCVVVRTDADDRIRINRFHSFIKERIARARGFATKNLNRYAALFSQIFGNQEDAVEKIFELMTARNGSFRTIDKVLNEDLLAL